MFFVYSHIALKFSRNVRDCLSEGNWSVTIQCDGAYVSVDVLIKIQLMWWVSFFCILLLFIYFDCFVVRYATA